VPRPRERILANLEELYKESYARASDAGDPAEMHRLDFAFRRDQLFLEAVLDVRDLLGRAPAPAPEPAGEASIIDQVGELRKLARLPFGR